MNGIGNTLVSGNTTGPQYSSANQLIKQQTADDAGKQQERAAVGSVNVASTAPTSTSQAATTTEPTVSPAYSVEISEEGAQMNSLSASAANEPPAGKPSGNSAEVSSSATSKTNSVTQTSNSSTSAVTENSDSSEDDSDTSNLTQYSDYQLQQMLNDGKITQSEYNAEIVKREAKPAETTNSNSPTNAINEIEK